jgi:hypothetical protein
MVLSCRMLCVVEPFPLLSILLTFVLLRPIHCHAALRFYGKSDSSYCALVRQYGTYQPQTAFNFVLQSHILPGVCFGKYDGLNLRCVVSQIYVEL